MEQTGGPAQIPGLPCLRSPGDLRHKPESEFEWGWVGGLTDRAELAGSLLKPSPRPGHTLRASCPVLHPRGLKSATRQGEIKVWGHETKTTGLKPQSKPTCRSTRDLGRIPKSLNHKVITPVNSSLPQNCRENEFSLRCLLLSDAHYTDGTMEACLERKGHLPRVTQEWYPSQ